MAEGYIILIILGTWGFIGGILHVIVDYLYQRKILNDNHWHKDLKEESFIKAWMWPVVVIGYTAYYTLGIPLYRYIFKPIK